MVYGGSLENFCGFVAHRRFESCPLCSSLVGFFHFPCSFLLLSSSLSGIIYLLEREEKQSFMKKSLICLDTLVLAAPIIIGSAVLMPFVVFDLARELVREERARRG